MVAPADSGSARPQECYPTTMSTARVEDEVGGQELGEESEQEEDPPVELVQEPDAETEPGASRIVMLAAATSDMGLQDSHPLRAFLGGHSE